MSSFLRLQKKNNHPAAVQPLSERYIELQHSAVKKEHVMGVPFPVIVGYSNYESSMLLGCHDYGWSPSCLLGKKITGVLHQSTFKDMPLSLPTVNVNGRFILLHPMTKFDYASLKYDIDRGNGQVAKIFDNYEEAIGWYREIVPGCDFDEDRNDLIQEVGSTESYVMVPRPVVSCDLMCKTVKDLSTYHNTQTPSASSNEDDSSSVPELVDRREDSDNDGNRADSDRYNIEQRISLQVAYVVMEQVVEDKKQELGRSGEEIPAKDVQVLALIKPEYLYASIKDGIDKYKKGDDFVYNYTVDSYHIEWQSTSDILGQELDHMVKNPIVIDKKDYSITLDDP